MFNDRTLVCKDCGNEFTFTVGEQEFYAEKGFQNDPTRCKDCRGSRRSQYGDSRREREMFDAVCSSCGADTKVPFRPHLDKPIYCKECFSKQR